MSPSKNQKPVVAAVYVAAMFLAIMDTTITNVALPAIGRDFHVPAEAVSVISVAYLVSLTVFIPVSGWLGDRIGGRRALLGAIALFTVASALCGLSGSMAELTVFRVIQGIGGAVMTPVGMAMLFRVYPAAERVRISSVLAACTALAPALGPVLGGLFTTYLSWRWVFFVNAPAGLAAVVFGALMLDGYVQPDPGRLDVRGLVLSGAGLGLTMYGVSEGPDLGWSSAPVLVAIVLGVVLLAAMVMSELRAPAPLISLRLLRNRLFSAATSLYGLGSVAYLGALFLAAVFFQNALGLSALQAGLATFPSAIGVMAGGQMVTRVLYWRFGPRRITAAGLTGVAVAMVLMSAVGSGTNLWLVRLIMFGLGLGISCVFIPAQAMSMATIGRAQTGQASPIFNAGKQLGGAVGVALLSTVVTAAGPARGAAGHAPVNLAAFHAGFLAAAAVAVLAIPVALTVRDADATATMVPPRKPGLAA